MTRTTRRLPQNGRRSDTHVIALLATICLMVVAACGDTGIGATTTSDSSSTPTSAVMGTPGEVSGGGVDSTFETLQEGTFTVGSTLTNPPQTFVENGEATGFEVEVVEAIASELGYDVEWIKTEFSGIVPGVSAKKFDFAASGITGWMEADSPGRVALRPRLEQVSLTRPYFLYSSALVTTDPNISSVEDLEEGMVVTLTAGGTSFLHWAMEELPSRGVEIQLMRDNATTYSALSAGRVDATIDVRTTAEEAARQNEDLYVGDDIPALLGGYTLAVSPDNLGLLDALNSSLGNIIDDGTYETIFKKYHPDKDIPELPSEPLTLEDVS